MDVTLTHLATGKSVVASAEAAKGLLTSGSYARPAQVVTETEQVVRRTTVTATKTARRKTTTDHE